MPVITADFCPFAGLLLQIRCAPCGNTPLLKHAHRRTKLEIQEAWVILFTLYLLHKAFCGFFSLAKNTLLYVINNGKTALLQKLWISHLKKMNMKHREVPIDLTKAIWSLAKTRHRGITGLPLPPPPPPLSELVFPQVEKEPPAVMCTARVSRFTIVDVCQFIWYA